MRGYFANGFAYGFFTCGAVFLIAAIVSACVDPLGRPFSDKEKALFDTDRQISQLNVRRAALLKALEEEKADRLKANL